MGEVTADIRYRWNMGVEARLLVMVTAALVAFGLATVYSASAIIAQQAGMSSASFFLKQLLGVVIGVAAFGLFAKLDAERWRAWAWPVMIVAIILLIVVILPWTESFAPRRLGSRRFLIGASVQPSELGKFAVIIWTSMLVVKKGDTLQRVKKGLLPFILVIGLLDVLVALEPDLSVAMTFTLIMSVILFAGGVRIGYFVLLGAIAVPLFWDQVQRLNYIVLRMTAFLDPGSAPEHASYQLRQSLIAVGSGQWFGVGFGRGRQQFGFLPLAYDDFIAATIGEEWGFLGLALVIIVFGAFGYLGFRIARNARTPFQQLVAVGITFTILITAYLHIGVAVGLLPTTGLTLPFISYGRSNLVMSLLMTGVLVNIGSSREKVIGASATDPVFAPSGA